MAINKVVYGNQTLIDITDTTALASDVAQGKEFYGPDGNKVVGTASGGITPTGTIAISQNGTYDVTNYASANVNVSGGGLVIDDVKGLFFYGARTTNIEDYYNALSSNPSGMQGMFYQCPISTINLSGKFGTSNITSLESVFYNCRNATSITFGNTFDTSNVTTMYSMFFNCEELLSLDLSHFNTSRVTTMYQTFAYCKKLSSLDLSSFDFSNVTTMQNFVRECNSLTTLRMGREDTNYSNITNSSYMFNGCSALSNVYIYGTSVLPITNPNAFTNLKSTCNFYVPSNLLSAYKSASNWSTRANYIFAIS